MQDSNEETLRTSLSRSVHLLEGFHLPGGYPRSRKPREDRGTTEVTERSVDEAM
jgi:hypothetical protein